MPSLTTAVAALVSLTLYGVESRPPSAPSPTSATSTYRESATSLDESIEAFGSLVSAGGRVWIAMDAGELLILDATGKGARVQLPTGGMPVYALWPEDTSVVAAVAGELFRVTAAGTVRSLAKVDPGAYPAIPVSGGYVGLFHADSRVQFVSDGGERRPLLFAGRGHEAKTSTDARGDAGDGDARSAPVASAARSASPQIPGPGFLTAMDADHVVYLMDEPYQFWILGMDGSSRQVSIDESEATLPEGPSWERAKVTDVRSPRTLKAQVHDGRLVVNRMYVTELEYLKDIEERGTRKGDKGTTRSHVVDLIDLESGRVVERVDQWHMKSPGFWAGLRGKDLVFLSPGADSHLTILSRQ